MAGILIYQSFSLLYSHSTYNHCEAVKTNTIWGHLVRTRTTVSNVTQDFIWKSRRLYTDLMWCKIRASLWDTTVSFHHMWDWLESTRLYVTVFTDTLSRMLLAPCYAEYLTDLWPGLSLNPRSLWHGYVLLHVTVTSQTTFR